MNGNWIKLYRQIMDNPFWKDKPFSKGQAWVDLLLKANYSDSVATINGEQVSVKRGQVFRSVKSLANEWGWSQNKVRRFLGELTAEHMAEVYGRTNGTLITIENYETFQNDRRTNGRTNRRTDGRTDGRHNKNNKEYKEESVPRTPTFEDVSKYVEQQGYEMDPAAFFDYYEETGWTKKNGQAIRDWKASVRTWARREREFKKTGQYGNGSKPATIEPPKYKAFKKEPEVDAVQMPEEIRKKMKERGLA